MISSAQAPGRSRSAQSRPTVDHCRGPAPGKVRKARYPRALVPSSPNGRRVSPAGELRCPGAWNKFAVRAILANPRYTGHQVWNKQRKDEVLIDVDDVALGHTKLRRNGSDMGVWSAKIVHPPVIDRETE